MSRSNLVNQPFSHFSRQQLASFIYHFQLAYLCAGPVEPDASSDSASKSKNTEVIFKKIGANLHHTYSYVSLNAFDMDQGEGSKARKEANSTAAKDGPREHAPSFPRSLVPGKIRTMTFRHIDAYTLEHGSAASGKLDEDDDGNGSSHVQFATYPEAEKPLKPLGLPPSPNSRLIKAYTPVPLRPYVWVPLVMFLVAAAIALEVVLHFSDKRQGWSTGSNLSSSSTALHYAYTLPPVAIVAVVVGLWAWTDLEIKKLQPYVDLVQGDSPPHRSLLLDYTRDNNFLVWARAAANQHYVVVFASLMGLMCLLFQPLAAALLVVKPTWIQLPDVTQQNLAQIGLNQDLHFNDLSSFLSSAGYAGASVMYDLPPPPFIRVPYTVAPFELPTSATTNGTAFANTTALKSVTGCQSAPVTMTQLGGGAWSNSIAVNDCVFTFNVTMASETLFGVDIPVCQSQTPPQFSPVVFWLFAYQPAANASATFCSPSFTLAEVNVGVEVQSGNITSLTEIGAFTSASNFSSSSANVTGAPLDGRAYNGIAFNLTNPDQFVIARQNATRLQLPASVYQAALQLPQGLQAVFDDETYLRLVNQSYSMYLALVAKEVYFLPDDEPITVQVKTFEQRVWLSHPAVHLLAVLFLILALVATFVQILHADARRYLRLTHAPGTIATAVSLGARTGLGDVLAGRHAEEEIREALADKRFRMNPDTLRIVMDTEEEYRELAEESRLNEAAEGVNRRRSVMVQGFGNRVSRLFGGAGSQPTTPRSPPRTPRTPATPRAHGEGGETA